MATKPVRKRTTRRTRTVERPRRSAPEPAAREGKLTVTRGAEKFTFSDRLPLLPLRELARHDFVSIQNHTWSHPRDLRLVDDERVRSEVRRAEAMLLELTGHRPTLFRFPGGYADERTVALVRGLGYQVVHWRWAEGDPDPSISADRLVAQTLERTRPGDILIFHVNGRGWHTAEALPRIVDGLAARGFRFVTVAGMLAPGSASR